MAEDKIRADANAVDFSKIARQVADEIFAGLFAEGLVKRNHQQRVRAERFNRAQFLRQRINQRRHAVRRDDGIRMPVKGEHQRDGVVLARIGDGLPDDLLVAEMHAVKNADGQADLAAAGVEFVRGVDDFHSSRRWRPVSRNGNTLFSPIPRPSNSTRHQAGIASATSNLPETLRRKVGQVRAAAEFLAEVVRQAADVSALGAGDAKFAERLVRNS